MRVTRAALLSLVVAIAVLTLAFTGQDAAGSCTGSGRCAAQRLPAPVTITAGHAAYRIARDGRVSHTSPPRSPYPRDATWFPGTNTWYRIEHTHLVVGRGRKALWRSHQDIAANQIGLIAAGPKAVTFQHDHRLYIAPLGGVERPVASRELPLGWTTGGLYTYSYPRRELLLRDNTGTVMKAIGRQPQEYQFDLDDPQPLLPHPRRPDRRARNTRVAPRIPSQPRHVDQHVAATARPADRADGRPPPSLGASRRLAVCLDPDSRAGPDLELRRDRPGRERGRVHSPHRPHAPPQRRERVPTTRGRARRARRAPPARLVRWLRTVGQRHMAQQPGCCTQTTTASSPRSTPPALTARSN